MERNEKDFEDWLASLTHKERDFVELLDAYLNFRSPMPPTKVSEKGIIAETKTTEDIREELSDMSDLPSDFIFKYLLMRGYGFTTSSTGGVKWAMWRMMTD